jgi:hypothetical protein
MSYASEGQRQHDRLPRYAAMRLRETSEALPSFVRVTDRYAKFICRVICVLGELGPDSEQDAVVRDLMGDVFDFLYEVRPYILRGQVHISYPLGRRAFEALSLMIACQLNPNTAARWNRGKEIGNAEVRKVLAAHPLGEKEAYTRELYKFFSLAAHPNRALVAGRYLGDGNEFVLGAIMPPEPILVLDHCIKHIDLWFWYAAFVVYSYREVLDAKDPGHHREYFKTANEAQGIRLRLVENYQHVVAEQRSQST